MSETRSNPLRVGVVGTGALGRHHVRIAGEIPEAELVAVYDERASVAGPLVEAHGGVLAASAEEVFEQVDCAIIATPTTSHRDLGCAALSAGCHVMVEKPIAATLKEADDLIAAAREAERVLAVGHVEFYNPAVQKLLLMSGKPRFLEIQRLSTFSPRSLDIDVILDLMIHDLQIVQALCAQSYGVPGQPLAPSEVRAVGIDVLSSKIDLADVRLEFATDRHTNCVANVRASRVSDQRVRQLRMFSDQLYCSLDYQEQSIKGFALREANPDASDDSVGPLQGHGGRQIVPLALDVEPAEPLREELEHFLAAVRGEATALVDGEAGRAALALALEIAELAG